MSEETEALEMLGKGYRPEPSIEIEPPRRVIHRVGGRLEEVEKAAFVKLSTAFKDELPEIDGNALKVWVYLALSVNRNTGKANPGVRTIAAGTGLAPNTVTDAVERLEALGLLDVNRGEKRYNIYEPVAYVSASQTDPKESKSVAKIETDGNQSVANFATDESQTVAISGQSVAMGCDLTRGTRLKNNTVDPQTRAAVLASPSWAIAAGMAYTGDPEQIALETLRKTWDRILKTNSPWERWGTFDQWLLQQERAGLSVEKFCAWFIADAFRRESVGMWTPKGDKAGRWSFVRTYPQAFPAASQPAQAAPSQEPEAEYVTPPSKLHNLISALA